MNATPTKRRALGSLDVNVARSPRSPSSTKLAANKGLVGLGGSPLKKRPAGGNNIVVTNNSSSRHGTPSPSRKKTTPTKRPLLSVFSDDKENGAALLLPAAKRLCSDARVIVEDVDEVCLYTTFWRPILLHFEQQQTNNNIPTRYRTSQ